VLAMGVLVFYVDDRGLGMTTVAGGGIQSQQGTSEQGPMARAFNAIGGVLIAILGRTADWIAILWEVLAARKFDRPPRVSGRVVLRLGVVLLLVFLAAPSFFIVP